MTSWRDGYGRRVPDGAGARRLLPRLLLAAVRDPLPARHDERGGDGPDHAADLRREAFTFGRRVMQAGAAILIFYGSAVLVAPALLPTFMSGHTMIMPDGSIMVMPEGSSM